MDAESAAEARDEATKQFGRVQRVEIVDVSYCDGPEDEEDEDEGEGNEEEQEQEGEGEEPEKEPVTDRRAVRANKNRPPRDV